MTTNALILSKNVKARFRGQAKNTGQLVKLFALSNLWMTRRHLLTNTGEVRP